MNYVAVDLGAESGRVMLGRFKEGMLSLTEAHRFANTPRREGASLFWDIDSLWAGILEGLDKAGSILAAEKESAASISVDSWGVDYVLLDSAGKVIPPTHHYRDPRTQRGSESMLSAIPWEQIFAETGIQYMPINTLFQLAAETPGRLRQAKTLLSVADYFNLRLGGNAALEVSMASTFQLYNPARRTWAEPLLEELGKRGLSREVLAPFVQSGEILGKVRAEIGLPTALEGARVIATCSHDTGAAVVATPLEPGARSAYLSSGTWSLMGVETDRPLINDLARELNFTNEIGHGHTVRLLKNISGLWLLQECRRAWSQDGRAFDYTELTRMAAAAPADGPLIDPSDARFLAPADMPRAIQEYCRQRNVTPLETPAAVTRCIFQSLAALYGRTIKQLERLTGSSIEALHVVGGGSRNDLLNQLTADACGIPVLAGPVEATAIGNVLVQAIALGEIGGLDEAREVVRKSYPTTRYEPAKASR